MYKKALKRFSIILIFLIISLIVFAIVYNNTYAEDIGTVLVENTEIQTKDDNNRSIRVGIDKEKTNTVNTADLNGGKDSIAQGAESGKLTAHEDVIESRYLYMVTFYPVPYRKYKVYEDFKKSDDEKEWFKYTHDATITSREVDTGNSADFIYTGNGTMEVCVESSDSGPITLNGNHSGTATSRSLAKYRKTTTRLLFRCW